MKNVLNTIYGLSMVLAVSALTACGGGGGGGAAATASAAAISGTPGMLGSGTWTGYLPMASNVGYMQVTFSTIQGNCSSGGYGAGYAGGYPVGYNNGFNNGVYGAGTAGYLPGPVYISVVNAINGMSGQPVSGCSSGAMNASNNGIVLNYYGNGYGGNSYAYNQAVMNGTPQLQILAQWIDATHATMNVQVLSNGVQVAGGTAVASGGVGGINGLPTNGIGGTVAYPPGWNTQGGFQQIPVQQVPVRPYFRGRFY